MVNNHNIIQDARKYLDYFFETTGFTSQIERREISAAAIEAARVARGAGRAPAIMVHGIMPRSGSVYVGELLRRHPDLYAYPYHLWEFPALQLTGDIRRLQQKFVLGYKMNRDKLAPDDFLPLFGASLVAYLYGPIPPEQRLLVKMPNVQYLTQFRSMFPHENLVILIRDGRDVVHSTLRTWRYLTFPQICLRWNRSAQIILNTCRHLNEVNPGGFWLARYEMALDDPASFIREACQHLGLDEGRYPYECIEDIRVIGSSKLEKTQNADVTGSSKLEKTTNIDWLHLKRPENFRPVDYWKEWSPLKKITFKAIAGRSLMQLGYCDNLNW